MTEREAFLAAYDVPRGTLDKLDSLATLLVDWQARFNLVGPSTLPHIWTRHFGDSAQLLGYATSGSWLDLGAGAGFPGLIVALMGARPVTLIDAVAKKCRFLDEAAATLGLQTLVTVVNARVESVKLPPADVISARAFAPLPRLLDWGSRLSTRSTTWILPKGQTAADEVETARATFDFQLASHPSRSDSRGSVLVLNDVRRRR